MFADAIIKANKIDSYFIKNIMKINLDQPDIITMYHPYRAVFPMDPRKIYSVGDQVVSEHIFAYHSRESIKDGFQPVISEVTFDHHQNQVTIHPKYPLLNSNGNLVPLESICTTLNESFKGTQHAPYRSIFIKSECKNGKVVISLNKIPVNLRLLFTLPDFSIFDPLFLPIKVNQQVSTTGPFNIEKIEPQSVWLKRNPYYPKELTANQIDHAVIHSYRSSEINKLVQVAKPSSHNLIYFDGFTTSEKETEILKEKGYRLKFSPSEWLAYLSFNSKVTLSDRVTIGKKIDAQRNNFMRFASLGQQAFSIAPSDRPFGLDAKEYNESSRQIKAGTDKLSKPYKIGVISTDFNIPLYQFVIKSMLKEFPELTLELVPPEKFDQLENLIDIFIDAIGITPADPLNHLSFLMNFDSRFSAVLTEEKITTIAIQENAEEFIKEVKNIEYQILKSRLIVPLAHFPGIVAEAPRFEKDESLSWSWGTQAWTYRVR